MALTMLSACAASVSHPQAGPDGVVGTGSHQYRFTLDDPSGGAATNTPFALSLRGGLDLPFVPEEKDVWRGTTDGQGRTPVFALPFTIEPEDVFLRGRLGDGTVGEQFVVKTSQSAVPGYPYRLIICTDPPQYMVGLTDENGKTFYGASQKPVSILLEEADHDIAAHGVAGLSEKQKAEFAADNIERCAKNAADDTKSGSNR